MAAETQSHGVQDTGNFTDEHIVWWTPPGGKKKKAAARLTLLQLNISTQVHNFLHKKFSQNTSLNFHFLTSFKQSFPGKIQPHF